MTFRIGWSFTLLALLAPAVLQAQSIDVPRPSPFAKVVQTVGVTDITVEYSSPGVRGRTIWGTLVPYGEVWRAGANATTKVTFSKDVTIGSTVVPAGSYAYFVIPNQSGPWTVIINKDYLQGGAFAYTKDKDIVRVDVTPEAIPNRERLAYIVSNFTNDTANLDLEWEKVRLSLPIHLNTDAQVAAAIKSVEDGAWEPYNSVANYQRLVKQDLDAAMTYVDKSIHFKETWQNLWTKAQILGAKARENGLSASAAKARYKSAVTALEKAIAVGKTAPRFFQDESAKALADWKSKL
jgi:hypothetical protein